MKRAENRKGIIIAAIVVSVVLYFAGVLSGLYANKAIEDKTEQEINSLKTETTQNLLTIEKNAGSQIESMRDYIAFLEDNLKTMQLEQYFSDTLDKDSRCEFTRIAMDHMHEELRNYWDVLPYRIEEYEHDNELSPEYVALKKQYTQLSLRTWVMASKRVKECDDPFVPVLYLYSRGCETCIRQGEQLDRFSAMMKEKDIQTLIFTIDIDSEEPFIQLLKDYYRLEGAPATIIQGWIYSGRVYTAEEMSQ